VTEFFYESPHAGASKRSLYEQRMSSQGVSVLKHA